MGHPGTSGSSSELDSERARGSVSESLVHLCSDSRCNGKVDLVRGEWQLTCVV